MASSRRARFVALTSVLARREVPAPAEVIASGRVLVDGRVVSNPAARVRSDAAVRLLTERRLRGDIKLSHALDHFEVPISGRAAVDLGASAGGFTTALLTRGARRVYAVEVGVGLLSGRLRADPRVVNLEGHNLGAVDTDTIPEATDLVTLDLGYLPIAEAIPQVAKLRVRPDAQLVALVKPTFELQRATLASSEEDVGSAVRIAVDALHVHGWATMNFCAAPVLGSGGAREVFLHACRGRP